MSGFARGGDPYRSSTGNLGVSERWDSERFSREHVERQRTGRGREPVGRVREPAAVGRQSLTTLEIDRERGRDRDRIGASRQRRQSLHFEDETSSYGGGSPPRSVATGHWAGSRSRRQSLAYDRPYVPPPPPPISHDLPLRSRPRPQSHASFTRRPYEYEEHSESRAPINVPIPLPRLRRSSPRRRREIEERDYEEIRVSEPDRYGDREYREIRERDRHVRRRSKSNTRYGRRSSSSSLDDFDERDQELPRGGRTRIPARLVSRRAVVELGYPYEEEGDTIIILRALGSHHIDQIIEITKEIRRTQPQPLYKAEEKTRVVRAIESAPARREGIETRTQFIPLPPAPPPPSGVEIIRDERIIPPHRGYRTEVIEVGESDGQVSGPLSLFAPDRRTGERSIKAEIRALEAEKKALRLEREVEHENRWVGRIRPEGGETLIIEEREGRRVGDVVIKKNKKGRLEMVR
ncbi:MAG: hypothetical protein M1839_007491 [Geoglossum umbratile]|nr:MAG: hypothetical protein M1839_007491 [Geoglossum umbratile]